MNNSTELTTKVLEPTVKFSTANKIGLSYSFTIVKDKVTGKVTLLDEALNDWREFLDPDEVEEMCINEIEDSTTITIS